MHRSLHLKRETLAALTGDDLAAVVGAGQETLVCAFLRALSERLDCNTPLCPTTV